MPASCRRERIHGGVGRDGSTPSTVRTTNCFTPALPRDRALVADRRARSRLRAATSDRRTCSAGSSKETPGRERVLAGEPADRERVAAIRRHVHIDGDVVETEQRDGVGADLGNRGPTRDRPDDAVVVVAEAQLLGGGDHAVRGWPYVLRAAIGNGPGSTAPGKCRDDLVAAARSSVRRRCNAAHAAVGLADIDLAPADESCRSSAARPRTRGRWPTTIGPESSKRCAPLLRARPKRNDAKMSSVDVSVCHLDVFAQPRKGTRITSPSRTAR